MCCCRYAETDAKVQSCLSSLRQAVEVVPDTRKCRRSSADTIVAPPTPAAESTAEQVSVSKPQTTETTDSVCSTTSQPFSTQQDINNFDIRDYLIDRCVTDTNSTTAVTTTSDNDVNCDDIDGHTNDDNRTENGPKSKSLELLQDPSERSVNPSSSTLPNKRFSDSQLIKRHSCPPSSAATLPGRFTSTAGGTDSRVKRHRWKLLRKALNLFSLDEAGAGEDVVARTESDDVRTARGDGVAWSVHADAAARSTDDVARTADDGDAAGTASGDAATASTGDDDAEDDGQSDGGTGQNVEEQPQRLDVHSISVESLPGSVPAHRHSWSDHKPNKTCNKT